MSTSARRLWVPLFLACACAVAAAGGSWFTIAPGYASALSPAAGVALAGVLLFGERQWLSIWLGSFLYYSWLDRSTEGIALAAMLATASAVQALLGARLAGRWLRESPPLAREREIAFFLLLGGPVACVLSATAGVAALSAFGRLGDLDLATQWVTWWCGDVSGVLLVVPLALLLLPKSPISNRRSMELWLFVLLTGALLVTARVLLHRHEVEEAHRAQSTAMEEVFESAFLPVSSIVDTIYQVERLFAVSQDVTAERFSTFSRFIGRTRGIVALAWAPRVRGEDRVAFEAGSGEVPSGVSITRISGDPAEIRGEYFPILYTAPPTGAALGIDLASEALRRAALERARDTGSPTGSALVLSVLTGRPGQLVFVPVYAFGFEPDIASVPARRAALRGFAVGVLDPAALLLPLADEASRRALQYRVSDVTEGGTESIFASTVPAGVVPAWAKAIVVAGRSWRLELQLDAPLAAGASGQALGLASVLVSFLMSLAVLASAGRAGAIRAEVVLRTAQVERELATRRVAEGALRANEEDLDTTLRSIGDAVLTTDARGHITRLNAVAESLTGWSEQEALGRPVDEVFNIINERTREPALVPVGDVLRTGQVYGLANHTVIIARDGAEHPIADSAAPIRDRAGQVRGVVLVFRDVEAEQTATRALHASRAELQALNTSLEQTVEARTHALAMSEQFNRDLFDFAPDAIVLADANGGVVRANRQAVAMFGWTQSELVGQPVEALMPVATRASHPGQRASFAHTNAPRVMGSGRKDLWASAETGRPSRWRSACLLCNPSRGGSSRRRCGM